MTSLRGLDNGYYLFGFDHDGNWKTLDGAHSDASSVRKALFLMRGMSLGRDIATWKLVCISDVEPVDDGTVNHEAMERMGTLIRQADDIRDERMRLFEADALAIDEGTPA